MGVTSGVLSGDMIRRLLLAADAEKWPYVVAEAAAAIRELNPGDAVAVTTYARTLLALKLGETARRVLDAGLTAGIEAEVLGPFMEMAAKAPSGVVAWTSRRRRFQANLRVLCERWPEYEQLAATWEAGAGRYELHQAGDGNYQVLDRAAGGLGAWTPTFDDHKAAVEAWKFDRATTPRPAPIAFDGIGHGWVLPVVMTSTEKTFLSYSCGIYVVEPDPLAFCVALHLQDLQEVFRQERVRVYVGTGALERMVADLHAHAAWPVPRMFIGNRFTGREKLAIEATMEGIVTERTASRAAALARLEKRYAGRNAAWWAKRYEEAMSGTGRPLRVFGATTRFSTVLRYSMEELAATVRASGHEMEIVTEQTDDAVDADVPAAAERYEPDLVVLISRMRYESAELPQGVPFLCWDQDNLPVMRTEKATNSINDLTYVAGHGALYGLERLGWPEKNCIFFRAAGCTHRYSNTPVAAELRTRVCDFSYVSNGAEPPETLLQELLRVWRNDARVQGLLEEIGEEILARSRAGYAWDSFHLDEFVRARETATGIFVPAASRYEAVARLRRVSDRAFRHVALGWVADYCQRHGTTMRLFGSGWKAHPVFGRFAEDFIAPGEELRALYQTTKINLQIIEYGFIHSRVLDGLAAGGFFLTRMAPEARDASGTGKLVYQMARQALRTGCLTNAQLRDSPDPVIQRGWAVMAETMKPEELRPELPCRYLRRWAATPTEETAFPQLDAVTFHDQESFNTLATRYLQDEAGRQEITDAMRQIVVEQFSYDACWQDALASIRRGLRKAAEGAA